VLTPISHILRKILYSEAPHLPGLGRRLSYSPAAFLLQERSRICWRGKRRELCFPSFHIFPNRLARSIPAASFRVLLCALSQLLDERDRERVHFIITLCKEQLLDWRGAMFWKRELRSMLVPEPKITARSVHVAYRTATGNIIILMERAVIHGSSCFLLFVFCERLEDSRMRWANPSSSASSVSFGCVVAVRSEIWFCAAPSSA